MGTCFRTELCSMYFVEICGLTFFRLAHDFWLENFKRMVAFTVYHVLHLKSWSKFSVVNNSMAPDLWCTSSHWKWGPNEQQNARKMHRISNSLNNGRDARVLNIVTSLPVTYSSLHPSLRRGTIIYIIYKDTGYNRYVTVHHTQHHKKTRKTKVKVTGLEPGLQTEVCVLNTGQ